MKRSEKPEDSYPSVEALYFMPFFLSHPSQHLRQLKAMCEKEEIG